MSFSIRESWWLMRPPPRDRGGCPSAAYGPSEIPFPLFLFHGGRLVEVDDPALALGLLREQHLLDDLGERGRGGFHRARERVAAQGPEADHLHLGLLAGVQRQALV